jgi:predicted glutamine amidotransferase
MCRLFFSYNNKDVKPLLQDFLAQSTNTKKNTPNLNNPRDYIMHQDGFGIAWKTETDKDWTVYKQPYVYTKHPDLDAVIARRPEIGTSRGVPGLSGDGLSSKDKEDIPNNLVIAHIRKKTHGDASMENTHPFHYQNQVFVQNGTIEDFEKHAGLLRSYISSPLKQHIKGETDTECLFFMLLSAIKYLQHRAKYLKILNSTNTTRKKHSKKDFYKKQIELYEDALQEITIGGRSDDYSLYINAFDILIYIFKKHDIEIVMNIIYGCNNLILLSRYIYYNKSNYTDVQIPTSLYWNKCNMHGDKGVLITSEPILEYDSILMPENTLTIVDYKKYELIIHTFNV